MQATLFSPPRGPSSAPRLDTSRGGRILRPKDRTRPIRMVLGVNEAGRFVVATCSTTGVADKSTAAPVSDELQAWLERPAPELPPWL